MGASASLSKLTGYYDVGRVCQFYGFLEVTVVGVNADNEGPFFTSFSGAPSHQ